jgi:hypothetical protein
MSCQAVQIHRRVIREPIRFVKAIVIHRPKSAGHFDQAHEVLETRENQAVQPAAAP